MLHSPLVKILFIVVLIVVASTSIILSIYFTQKDKYRGAVAANGVGCAEIGQNILQQGGSAVDSAIATLFCEGIMCPHSMGLGGGFFMVIYSKENRQVKVLNARETAPAAANQDMFVGKPGASSVGGLAIAIPGELKGYYEAYREYGRLPWHKLVEPSIELCKNGIVITFDVVNAMKEHEQEILSEPSLREIFVDPQTNQTWKEGDIIKRPVLAKTLEIIAEEGANALYSRNGTLFSDFMKDLKQFGSIITDVDMLNYKVQWEDPVTSKLDEHHDFFSMGLPSSGLLLSFMLNIIKGYEKIDNSILSIHQLMETFKFAYAERSYLGDPAFVEGIEERIANLSSTEFADYIRSKINNNHTFEDLAYYGANFSIPSDHGTAHISVLSPDGDAVAVTSTINLFFGCLRRSQSTGIILNDEMDDFSTPGQNNEYGVPPSPSNYIKPGKRPMSSMTPTIVINSKGQPVLIVGGAGGTKITTSVAETILNYLYKGMDIEEAIESPRIYHQLMPMHVEYENTYDPSILDLQKFKHKMKSVVDTASVVAISSQNGVATGSFDSRRGGSVAYVI